MRRATLLAWILLLLAAAAQAQGPTGAGTAPAAEPVSKPAFGQETAVSRTSGRRALITGEYEPWQIAFGYQYTSANLLGSPFNENGENVSVSRHFWRWVGAEGQIASVWGNTRHTSNPSNLSAWALYVSAGPRVAFRNRSRFEPWVHALVGMEYLRLTRTGFVWANRSLTGTGGGGMDTYLSRHVAFRLEADVVGSQFLATTQRSYQGVGGLVLHF